MTHEEVDVHGHIKLLADLDARTTSNERRLDNIDKLLVVVNDMNTNVAVIAEQARQQGKELKVLVDTLKTHEQKIDILEDKMGTKETLSKLDERVEILERAPGNKSEKLLEQIKWLLITLMISGIFGISWNFITK